MDEKVTGEHIRNFAVAAVLSSAATAALSVFRLAGFGPLTLLDALLMAILAVFVYFYKSRTASTLMVVYWLYNMWYTASTRSTGLPGVFIHLVFLFFFSMGCVATYHYHSRMILEKKEKKLGLMARRIIADLVEVVVIPLGAGLILSTIPNVILAREWTVGQQVHAALVTLIWVVAIMYVLFKDSFFQGQSFLKMALCLRVVDVNSRIKCRWWQSLVRNLIFLVTFSPLIELVVLYSNSERRRIGDYLAGTVVVDADEPFHPKARPGNNFQENALKAITALLAAGLILSLSFIAYLYISPHNLIIRIKQSYDPVVVIYTYDRENRVIGFGSGFFVNSSGVVVTNHHVLENAVKAVAVFRQKQFLPVEGIIDDDKEKDIVILKVRAQNTPFLTLGDSDKLDVGEDVYTIGSPVGLEYTVSKGIISQLRNAYGIKLIQIDAPISPGSSGGPLLNSDLKVIGINVAYVTNAQNLNFAIPINYAKMMLVRAKVKFQE